MATDVLLPGAEKVTDRPDEEFFAMTAAKPALLNR